MTRILSFIISVFVLFTAQGCHTEEVKTEAPGVTKLKRNTDFIINLEEDHRTGYNWQLMEGYNTAVIQHVNEVWHGNEKGIYFNLHTLATGACTLTFMKRKYTDTADTKHFIVEVTP